MDEEFSGALGGAAQGAAAGASFGPWGAAIGGVVGAVGGLFGGSAAKKARKYANRAARFEQASKVQTAALARRDMLRQARAATANAIAIGAAEDGGSQSSTVQGATASAGSQVGFNLGYMENQYNLQTAVTRNLAKAGKAQNQAQDIFGLLTAGAQITQAVGQNMPRTPPGELTGGWQPASSPSAGIGISQIISTVPLPSTRNA